MWMEDFFISVGVLGLVVGSGPSDMGDCLI